jgi:hypothetical protein
MHNKRTISKTRGVGGVSLRLGRALPVARVLRTASPREASALPQGVLSLGYVWGIGCNLILDYILQS